MSFLFGGGMRFSPADLEPLQGEGDRLRSAGRMLHDAAGALDFAQRASAQLQNLTDGVSWRGNAFHAFKAGVERQPLPNHLVNARNVLGWTGDELARLARVLDDIQQDFLQLRNRADLLGIDGDVPEERQAEVEAIQREYDHLKERREQALEQAAHVIEEMTDKAVFARPPPKGLFGKIKSAVKGAVNFTKDFASGVLEGFTDIGKGLVLLGSLATPWGIAHAVDWVRDNRHLIRNAISYALHDPLGMAVNVGKVLVDYDTLTQNPGRWLGKLAPQILIAVATAGAGGVAARSGAIAVRGTTPTGRLAAMANRIKIGTEFVDRAIPGVRRFGATADLTVSQAFKKGVLDTFINRPLRNMATGGMYGRAQRARYLLHGRKELPMWGKLTKKVPGVTTLAAGREAVINDLTTVIDEGAARAQEEQTETR